MPVTLVDPGQVGLVSEAVNQDRLMGLADATGETYVDFFYALSDNPPGGGPTVIEINDDVGGVGGGQVVNSVELTILDGDLQAQLTDSLVIAALQGIYRRVTTAPPAALNLSGYVSAIVQAAPPSGPNPVPVGGDLCTLDSVKLSLGFTDTTHDVQLAQIISTISVQAQNWCQRILTPEQYRTWFYNTVPSSLLVLPQFPADSVNFVTEVIEDGILLTEGTSYRFEGRKLRRLRDTTIGTWGGEVNVLYQAGYAPIPMDLQGVVCDQVIHNFNQSVASGQAYMGLSNKTTNVGGSTALIQEGWLPHVETGLTPYRRVF